MSLEYHKFYLKYENSFIVDIFFSQIIYEYICTCKYIEYRLQKIMDIPLCFPDKISSVTLYNLLNLYFISDIIEFETICPQCKNKTKHKKIIKISKTPEILIISLQRIDNIKHIKNYCLVDFPFILDINNYTDKNCEKNTESKYELFGIINHIGFIDFGHYMTFNLNKIIKIKYIK